MRRRGAHFYLGLAMLLATGAPLGWLALQALRGQLPPGGAGAELRQNGLLYAYLWVGTTLALGVLGWLADALARANARLRERAVTDATTGLKNVRYFHEQLARELSRARRDGRPLCLVAADLDHFKRVNDVHGHAVGDRVLAAAARVLEHCVRAEDVACRVGGEEFTVICPGATAEDALHIAERIREGVERVRVPSPKGTVKLTLSLGVCVYRPGEPAHVLASRADAALYAAKRGGRNRVELAASAPERPPADQGRR
ncbi:MAG TPA: GGDEF domain-containing protein [Aggregicoccus sp.]|nr:GGDEF domain-containing protein [Aggregicoccus sp.]